MTIKAQVYERKRKLKDLLTELRVKYPRLDFPKLSRIVNGFDNPLPGLEMEVCRILDKWDAEQDKAKQE